MRLPGSHNSKEGDWLPVEIVCHHKERRYELEALEDWLDRADVVITAKPKAKTNGAANGTPFVLPPSIKPAWQVTSAAPHGRGRHLKRARTSWQVPAGRRRGMIPCAINQFGWGR